MSAKVKIQNPSPAAVSQFGDQVFLDLPEGVAFRGTKAIQELTEIEEISQEAALAIDVPLTSKNRLILYEYTINSVYLGESIPVEVTDGDTILGFTSMSVKSVKSRVATIELYGSGWVDDLKKIKMNALDLGLYSWDIDTMKATWLNDTDPEVAVPVVAHYGLFYNVAAGLVKGDLRIWFNLNKLMKACFCAIGWEFKSPYYEGEVGRWLYSYLSGKYWHWYSTKNDIFKVIVDRSTITLDGNPTVLIWDGVIQDPYSLYNNMGPSGRPDEYLYPPSGETPAYMRIIIEGLKVNLPKVPSGEPAAYFWILVYKNRPPAVTFLFYDYFAASANEDITKTLNYEVIDEDCRAGDSYNMFVGYGDIFNTGSGPGTNYDFTILEAQCSFAPDPPRYANDDEIPVGELLDETLNPYELLKGMVHLCNGKILTDFAGKTVTLYPPYDARQRGERIEGFFIRNQGGDELAPIQRDSMEMTVLAREKQKNLLLAFADPTDVYTKEKFPNTPAYSRLIVFDQGVNTTEEKKNPVFEPLLEKFVTDDEIGHGGFVMPVLWDAGEGIRSKEPGRRVGVLYPKSPQVYEEIELIIYVDDEEIKFPAPLSQVPTFAIDSSIEMVQIAFAEFQNDLYRLFWSRWLKETRGNEYEFLVYLSAKNYAEYNFRKPFWIRYEEAVILLQLTAIKDYEIGGASSTPARFVRINQNNGLRQIR